MTTITRRGLLQAGAAIGALGALGGHPARAQEMSAHEKQLYEAAKKEGEVTWYSGQLSAEPGEAVGKAFGERYPGLKANVIRSTSQVAFQRLSQDFRARTVQCDIFSSTDSGHYAFLKKEGLLTKYRPKNADGMIDAARRGDADDMFQTCYFGLYLMGFNTQKVSEAEAPKSWTDLLDPKWKDQIAIGHPGYSGAIGIWALMMKKLYGIDYLKKLEKNKPQIGRSSMDPVTLMNGGERAVGIAIPSATTLLSISRGNPLKLIYPTDGTVATPAPTAIIANCPHPNAAKLFMEFATGPEYSRVITRFFNESLRPEVAPPVGGRPLNEIKLIMPTMEEAETGVPEMREAWRDIFGV
ncbi:ABC transporter substrate-binding protein [Stella sp.]|uniref:ABC transporter substrate-binding protein n=1 Tax=Stella sp. TaxID=2912054 RepID=UPI0035AE65C5